MTALRSWGALCLVGWVACSPGQSTTVTTVDLDRSLPPGPASAAEPGEGAPPPPQGRSSEPRVVDGGTYEVAPGLLVPESWVDCRIESDCAIVEAGCCDHCNGGVITSVNAAYAARLRPLLARFGCREPPVGCGAEACDPASAHELVCMTRACHIVDLEPAVQGALWGDGDGAGSEGAVDGVVSGE